MKKECPWCGNTLEGEVEKTGSFKIAVDKSFPDDVIVFKSKEGEILHILKLIKPIEEKGEDGESQRSIRATC